MSEGGKTPRRHARGSTFRGDSAELWGGFLQERILRVQSVGIERSLAHPVWRQTVSETSSFTTTSVPLDSLTATLVAVETCRACSASDLDAHPLVPIAPLWIEPLK